MIIFEKKFGVSDFLSQLLNNISFTVTPQNNIKLDYYPFIIAIPNKYNI